MVEFHGCLHFYLGLPTQVLMRGDLPCLLSSDLFQHLRQERKQIVRFLVSSLFYVSKYRLVPSRKNILLLLL